MAANFVIIFGIHKRCNYFCHSDFKGAILGILPTSTADNHPSYSLRILNLGIREIFI